MTLSTNTFKLTPYFATEETKSASTILVVEDLEAPVNRLVTGILYVSAAMTNIQGDIDAGGAPRQNATNLKGILSSAGYKRKIRDTVQMIFDVPMHVNRRGVLLQGNLDAALAKAPDSQATTKLKDFVFKQRATLAKAKVKDEAVSSKDDDSKKTEKKEKAEKGEDWSEVVKACFQYFFDDRTFGRLFTDPVNEGSTGPVQISHFLSLHPIEIIEMAVACTAVANWKEKEEKHSTIGRVSVVNYGLYEGTLVCNPFHAAHTGFSWNDLNKILNVIPLLWDITQSSSRTGVAHERMTLFVHDSPTGSMSLADCKKLAHPINANPSAPDMPRQSTDDYEFKSLEELNEGLNPGVKVAII